MSSVSMSGRWLQHNDASARLPAKPSESGASANFPLRRFRPILQTTFATNVNAKRKTAQHHFSCNPVGFPEGGLVACLSVHNQPIGPSLKISLSISNGVSPHFRKKSKENMKIDMAC